MTSSLAGIVIIILLVWAIAIWYRDRGETSRRILRAAMGSFLFVVIEGLLGAGLVLTGNTAENLTPERPFWMAAHLLNTLVLLAFLAMTAWFAGGDRRLNFRVPSKHLALLALALVLILVVGMSGSIAALSSMIFPSTTLAQGLANDLSPTSHVLLRLRLLHPILSIGVGIYLILVTGWLKSQREGKAGVARWSNILSLLVVVQIAFGAATLLMLAPIVMQLGHLFLADAIWISTVLFTANFLRDEMEAADPVQSPSSDQVPLEASL
jgi:heme a synthase